MYICKPFSFGPPAWFTGMLISLGWRHRCRDDVVKESTYPDATNRRGGSCTDGLSEAECITQKVTEELATCSQIWQAQSWTLDRQAVRKSFYSFQEVRKLTEQTEVRVQLSSGHKTTCINSKGQSHRTFSSVSPTCWNPVWWFYKMPTSL